MLELNLSSLGFKVNATIAILAISLIYQNIAQAQVVSDDTTGSQVNVSEKVFNITGGTQAGQNLFHSFEQFSLSTGSTAYFNNLAEINHIFSRVTGGSVSEIDGSIAANGNASLFLLNPAGIIFGANAQLDIGGSFIATTGDRLIFEDGVEFSAVAPDNQPLLTVSIPAGIQYGMGGNIIVLPNLNRSPVADPSNGLSIKPGNTLALIGGDVAIERNDLNALNGNLEIGSVGLGTVKLESVENGWRFSYEEISEFKQISLDSGTFINSTGIVNLRAQKIAISGSGIRSFTQTNGTGGIINLGATESIILDNGFLFTQVGEFPDDTSEKIAGKGGNISLAAAQITFTNGSFVSAGTLGQGAGGDITINATESVVLSGGERQFASLLSTSTQGSGAGGRLSIDTSHLIVRDGSQIQAFAGEGAGGTIVVNATESIELSGRGTVVFNDENGNEVETVINSGLAASSGVSGLDFALQPGGESGNLIINTRALRIGEAAQISVSNFGPADAGDIQINAETLDIENGGEIVAETSSGQGGSISIAATDSVILENQGEISTTAERNGDGGNIEIDTDNLVLLENERITADAQQGAGGKIQINALGFFVDSNSSITATSDIETQIGTVDIITRDLNSRIETREIEVSFLNATDYIITGCGVGEDFAENQFRDVGRGGLPPNFLERTASEDVLSDLGNVFQMRANVKQAAGNFSPEYPPIVEAAAWIINDRGNVELVTQTPNNFASPLACHSQK